MEEEMEEDEDEDDLRSLHSNTKLPQILEDIQSPTMSETSDFDFGSEVPNKDFGTIVEDKKEDNEISAFQQQNVVFSGGDYLHAKTNVKRLKLEIGGKCPICKGQLAEVVKAEQSKKDSTRIQIKCYKNNCNLFFTLCMANRETYKSFQNLCIKQKFKPLITVPMSLCTFNHANKKNSDGVGTYKKSQFANYVADPPRMRTNIFMSLNPSTSKLETRLGCSVFTCKCSSKINFMVKIERIFQLKGAKNAIGISDAKFPTDVLLKSDAEKKFIEIYTGKGYFPFIPKFDEMVEKSVVELKNINIEDVTLDDM